MSWTYEQAAEVLGDIGQTCAGNLIAYNGTHILVGSTSVTGVFSLTEEGVALLERIKADRLLSVVQAEVPPAEEPVARTRARGKKVEPESAKVEVPPPDDLGDIDVDLS